MDESNALIPDDIALRPGMDINAHVPRLIEQGLGIAPGMLKLLPPKGCHVRVIVVDFNEDLCWIGRK